MVRRRRDEPLWPFALLCCVLFGGVGAVVVITRPFRAVEEAPAGDAAIEGGSADDGPLEEMSAEGTPAEEVPVAEVAGGDAPVDDVSAEEPPAEGAPAPAEPGPRLPTPEDRIRIEVLNGGGVPGVAGAATDILRRKGFDVVYFGNESPFGRDSSVILDRTGVEGAVGAISEELGIGISRAESDTTRLVDVTVLLGTDWQPPLEVPRGTSIDTTEPSDVGEDGSAIGRPWSWRNLLRLIEGVL